jgi:hypothetical protein
LPVSFELCLSSDDHFRDQDEPSQCSSEPPPITQASLPDTELIAELNEAPGEGSRDQTLPSQCNTKS